MYTLIRSSIDISTSRLLQHVTISQAYMLLALTEAMIPQNAFFPFQRDKKNTKITKAEKRKAKPIRNYEKKKNDLKNKQK